MAVRIGRRALLLLGGAWLALRPRAGGAAGVELPGPLVDPDWLAAHLDVVRVIDIRDDVAGYHGRRPKGAEQGHIAGAVPLALDAILRKGREDGVEVPGMVVDGPSFAALARGLGIGRGTPVVIAAQGRHSVDMHMATRLFWTFRYYGHDAVAVLDGGTRRWRIEGRPLVTDPPEVTPGDFEAGPGRGEILATTAEVEEAVRRGTVQLVDARPPQIYAGTKKPRGFPVAGHIRGAKNLPHPELFANRPDGALVFRSAEELRGLARSRGIDPDAPTITYCMSGFFSSGTWFVFHELFGNRDTQLYDGSMLAWVADRRRRELVEAAG